MENILAYTVLGILFLLFLYFGYRHDYRRSPNEFFKTIIGVPIIFISSIFGPNIFGKKISDWIQEKKEEKKEDKKENKTDV